MTALTTALATADWRQRVFGLYGAVRERAVSESPEAAHALWRTGRDELFRDHPASALRIDARESFAGLAIAPYDPAFRFEAVLDDGGAGEVMDVETGTDGVVPFRRLGTLLLPGLGQLALWKLASYGGGLFLPLRDGTAGRAGGTYGGGRYVLDTIKGAHLGEGRAAGSLVVDLNFAYNPSCAYDEEWACPLPGPDNRLVDDVPVGELYREY
jgi:uncharacterized protein (DUF1684 family)